MGEEGRLVLCGLRRSGSGGWGVFWGGVGDCDWGWCGMAVSMMCMVGLKLCGGVFWGMVGCGVGIFLAEELVVTFSAVCWLLGREGVLECWR